MLTTVDNPFDPNKDYDQWLQWDHEHGYYTQELLARVVPIDPDVNDSDRDKIITEGINQIIDNDPVGIYKMI